MKKSQRTRFFIAFLLMILGIGLLVAVSFRGSMVYYMSVSEYLQFSGRDPGPVRVNGRVVPGSIEKEPAKLGVRFAMTDGENTLPVMYGKIVPDKFVERAEVVVEGKLDPTGVFQANVLLAKCPSKYEAEDPADHPELE